MIGKIKRNIKTVAPYILAGAAMATGFLIVGWTYGYVDGWMDHAEVIAEEELILNKYF